MNFQYREMVGLPCVTVQADEVWCFCGMKEKTAKAQGRAGGFGVGDVWTYSAICADTRLVLSWLVGERDSESAISFLLDLERRIDPSTLQLSTGGLPAYVDAVRTVFGNDIDYGQVIKQFAENPCSPAATILPSASALKRLRSAALRKVGHLDLLP